MLPLHQHSFVYYYSTNTPYTDPVPIQEKHMLMNDMPNLMNLFISMLTSIPSPEFEPPCWVHAYETTLSARQLSETNTIQVAVHKATASYKQEKGLGENDENLITTLFPQLIKAVFALAKKKSTQINSEDIITLSNEQRFFIQNQDTDIYLCSALSTRQDEVVYDSRRLTSYKQINRPVQTSHFGTLHPSHQQLQAVRRPDFGSNFQSQSSTNWEHPGQLSPEARHTQPLPVNHSYHTRSSLAHRNQLGQSLPKTQQNIRSLDDIAREIASNSSGYLPVTIRQGIDGLFGSSSHSITKFLTYFALQTQESLIRAISGTNEFKTIFAPLVMALISLLNLENDQLCDIVFFKSLGTVDSCLFIRKNSNNEIHLLHRTNKQESVLMLLMLDNR